MNTLTPIRYVEEFADWVCTANPYGCVVSHRQALELIVAVVSDSLTWSAFVANPKVYVPHRLLTLFQALDRGRRRLIEISNVTWRHRSALSVATLAHHLGAESLESVLERILNEEGIIEFVGEDLTGLGKVLQLPSASTKAQLRVVARIRHWIAENAGAVPVEDWVEFEKLSRFLAFAIVIDPHSAGVYSLAAFPDAALR